MAELRRKDEEFIEPNDKELTTADLARGGERPRDPEQRVPPQSVLESTPPAGMRDSNLRREGSVPAVDEGRPLVTATPTDFDSPAVLADGQPAPLFSESEVVSFRSQWTDIQSDFVDEPRRAVQDADNLVASLMKKLADGFANERERLEKQWDRGDNVSTEDLRISLQRYRSFFDRLLKV